MSEYNYSSLDDLLESIEDVLKKAVETDQVTEKATNQVEKLLSKMKNNWMSRSELMNKLDLTHKPTFRENYLNPAIIAGLIITKFPDSPRSPKQKYRKV